MKFEDRQKVTVNFPGQVRRGHAYEPCAFTGRVLGRDNEGDRILIVAEEDAQSGAYMYVPVAWIA